MGRRGSRRKPPRVSRSATEKRRLVAIATALLSPALLLSCAREEAAPVFFAEGYPAHLSDWRLVATDHGVLKISAGAVPYDLATPLFSDYAQKLRTVTLPKGTEAVYDAEDSFDFPVGTIFSKTFYYSRSGDASAGEVAATPERTVVEGGMPLDGVRLIETRLLVHRPEGWVAIPYVWNEAQSDAALARAGAVIRLVLQRPGGRKEPFNYIVPNQNQCAGCHATNNTTRALSPIGLKARHLNKPSSFAPGLNQLDHWMMTGMLAGAPADGSVAPRNAAWTDETASVDARARAYLDANCSHCHSNVGPADASGLDLRPSVPFGPAYGGCKSPVAAGGGSGGRLYDIVPGAPDQSIFVYRLESTKPGHMMPELGRSVAHEEGIALIAAWIAAMNGGCS